MDPNIYVVGESHQQACHSAALWIPPDAFVYVSDLVSIKCMRCLDSHRVTNRIARLADEILICKYGEGPLSLMPNQ